MSELVPGDLDECLESERLRVRIFRLEAALREALDGWRARCKWVDDGITDNVPIYEEQSRITALRKEFLV